MVATGPTPVPTPVALRSAQGDEPGMTISLGGGMMGAWLLVQHVPVGWCQHADSAAAEREREGSVARRCAMPLTRTTATWPCPTLWAAIPCGVHPSMCCAPQQGRNGEAVWLICGCCGWLG